MYAYKAKRWHMCPYNILEVHDHVDLEGRERQLGDRFGGDYHINLELHLEAVIE